MLAAAVILTAAAVVAGAYGIHAVSTRQSSPAAASATAQPLAALGQSSAPSVPLTTGLTWMIAQKGLGSIDAADHQVAERAFDRPQTFVIKTPGTPVPYGTPVADFVSFSSLERSIANGAIDPSVHWVMYDNEGWAATPDNEKAAPADYEARFAALAHAHGYKVVLAPATNLVPGWTRGARVWPDYLAAGFPRFSASVADVYEIQAQPWEGTPDYAQFVQAAVAQARQANPHIIVFAGLCSCRVPSGAQMLADVTATRGLLSGYWLNLLDYGVFLDHPERVAARVNIAIDLLKTV